MCQTANRVYVYGIDTENGVAYWGRPDCKLWSCPDCAETNKRRWTAIVAEGIKAYQAEGITEWKFITMTTRGDRRGWETSLHDFRQRWPKLHERMKRRWGKQPYVLLPERHKDGTFHQHGLFAGGVTTRWMKDNCASTGFGYKAEAQAISSLSQCAFYVLKYVTKSLSAGTLWPRSLHRVRTSQHWPRTTFVSDFMPVTLKPCKANRFEEMLNGWIASGYEIVNIKSNGGEECPTTGQINTMTGEILTDWHSLNPL